MDHRSCDKMLGKCRFVSSDINMIYSEGSLFFRTSSTLVVDVIDRADVEVMSKFKVKM